MRPNLTDQTTKIMRFVSPLDRVGLSAYVSSMALTYSEKIPFGTAAPDFDLLNTDGKRYSLADFSEAKALLVIFMCNHCPYVIAVQDRINDLAKKYGPRGVRVVGINSNDSVRYPADSYQAMQARAKELGYAFAYLWDDTQSVARDYGAVCTPDPYLFENDGLGNFLLRYHGRIDDNWKVPAEVRTHELANAIECVLEGREVAPDQNPAMGCSIKWKI